MNIRRFLLAINYMQFINVKQKNKLIHFLSDQSKIILPIEYQMLKMLLQIDLNFQDDYQKALEYAINYNGNFICIIDPEYPEHLRQISQPPIVLSYKGDIQLLNLSSLTVVGTRLASQYSMQVLRKLLPEIIENKIAIVSGLARGVDAIAHQITLGNLGKPIAVIGTGLDRNYPSINAKLQNNIAERGLLLSEYPDEFGPRKQHFPARNRILAGLSSATLVVEAKKRSGSLITANLANEFGRNVLAIPGKIDDINSVGANDLINQGAKIINDSQDILNEIYRFS